MSMRVHDLAAEFGVTSDELIATLREMDIFVRSHLSSLEDDKVSRVRARCEREKRKEKQAAAPAKGRRRHGEGQGRGGRAATEPVEAAKPKRRRRTAAEVAAQEAEAAARRRRGGGREAASRRSRSSRRSSSPSPRSRSWHVTDLFPPELAPPEEAAETRPRTSPIVTGPPSAEAAPAPERRRAGRRRAAARRAGRPTAAAAQAGGVAHAVGHASAPAAHAQRAQPVRPHARRAPAVGPAQAGRQRRARARWCRRAPWRRPRPARRHRTTTGATRRASARRARSGRWTRRRWPPTSPRRWPRSAAPARRACGAATTSRRSATLEAQRVAEEKEREKTLVRVNEFISVAELAQILKVPPSQLVSFAFKELGLMVTVNQRLDFDQIELICSEFGFQAVREAEYVAEADGGRRRGGRRERSSRGRRS